MNLTDEGFYFERSGSPELASRSHATNARAVALSIEAKNAGATTSDQLGGFFSKVADSLKRTIKFPIEVAKASFDPKKLIQVHKDEIEGVKGDIRDMGKVAAPVLSLFGPIGMAAGAAVGFLSKKFQAEAAEKKARLVQATQANDPNALIAEYRQYEGQVPGRVYGAELMQQILRAGFITKALLAYTGQPVGAESADGIFSGLDTYVRDAVSKGETSSTNILNAWMQTPFESGTYGSNQPWSTSLGRSIALDSVDALLVKYKPDAPISYGVAASAYEQPAATPAPLTASVQPFTPQVQPTRPADHVAPGQAINHAGVSAQNSAATAALLEQLRAQGANADQMMRALSQSLTNSGVNTKAPLVMEAMKAEVQTAQSAPNYVPWILGGLGILAAVFFLKRKKR